MTILFVTRKFPPSVGGMETLAADVWAGVRSADSGARLVAHGGSNQALPLFLPVAAVRTATLVLRRAVQTVLVGDVLLYVVLSPLLRALKVPHAVMAMGKDVLWPRPLYQALVRRTLRHAPSVLAISAATARAAQAAGADAQRVHTVRLGVAAPVVAHEERQDARRLLAERLAIPDGSIMLVTLGRLIPRKGVAWFVRHVLPALPAHAVLLVAGGGEDAGSIKHAVTSSGQGARVRLLGPVTDADRELLMLAADVFVQPNIKVAGDMEGFGLVAVEAAVRGACVVAADLEGLQDAVRDGETGILVRPGDAAAWQDTLMRLISDREALARSARSFQERARDLYSVEAMGRDIVRLLGSVRPRN